jgi:DNA-binding FadR family transcriptional regulator
VGTSSTEDLPPAEPERRRYLDVADEILRSVALGAISPGDRLPNERQLAERCHVSRSTVREALVALELSGVVEVRRGSGCYLTGFGAGASPTVTTPVDASPRDLLEVRRLVEPALARSCAGRIQRDQLTHLRRLIDQAHQLATRAGDDTLDEFVAVNLTFHRDLARCSGNMVAADVTGHLVDTREHPLWLLIDRIVVRNPSTRLQQVAEHRAIVDALAAGQGDVAARAMAEHLGALSSRMFGLEAPPPALTRTHRRRG